MTTAPTKARSTAVRTLYWHDYETFGTDPQRDRPAQFAGIRTDEELNIIGEPLEIYCQPANDFLPHPQACLITAITPQEARQKGLIEAEFIKRIQTEMARPNTCTTGYNNIRFDDEFTRNTLYRNFYDPYAREWQNGNSRWDILDLLRVTHALRPEGINWPEREDGHTSFRLEKLTAANNISHQSAHDALSDVIATIAIARLVKNTQPRLYQYIYEHRFKYKIQQLFDRYQQTPLVHISGMYPAHKGHMGIVIPVAIEQRNKNAIIVYELHHDPQALLKMDTEQIRHFTFTAQDDLAEGEQRLPLKTIHINKCPVVVPLNTLTPEVMQRCQIDLSLCKNNLQTLLSDQSLSERIQSAFQTDYSNTIDDPDLQLYSGGFFSPADQERMQQIRQSSVDELNSLQFNFDDPRLHEMLFRYRCRNYPDTLLLNELQRWNEYRISRMTTAEGSASIKLEQYRQELQELKQTYADNKQIRHILNQLEQYPAEIGLENNH